MGLPSSQVTPGRGVTVQLAVPLHARAAQVSVVQVTAVPRQAPDVHESVWVHALPSSQRAPVRHCQAPPSLVQTKVCPPQESDWQSEWTIASHANSPPPPQVPDAFAAPHPWQTRPVRRRLALHWSAQSPAVVRQPIMGSQLPRQHWLPEPGAHIDGAAPRQVPAPSQTSPVVQAARSSQGVPIG
jgi:hypothetical protein